METIDIGLADATVETVNLSKELLVLRLAFGKLKAAISDAAAPLLAVMVPGLQKAVFWAIRFTKQVSQVIAALLGVKVSQAAVEKKTVSLGKSLKRSLAGFDKLERLNGGSGAGKVVTTRVNVEEDKDLAPGLQRIVDKIKSMLQPLRELDFTPIRWHIARLSEAFGELKTQVGAGVQWLWHQLFVPFATFVVERLAPVFLNTLTSGVKLLTAALGPLQKGFDTLWKALQPVTEYIGLVVLMVLDQFRRLFNSLANTITENSGQITGIFQNLAQVVEAIWQVIGPVLTELNTRFALTFADLRQAAGQTVSYLLGVFGGLTDFLAGVFTGDWKRAWNGLSSVLKGAVNTLIGFLNGLLSGVAGAFNGIIGAINKLKFTVPDWVPVVGGKNFGVTLKTVTTPKIPYLARGAVLPANQPFLAVVGDQRHGTNVEAPLATIEEAVSLALEERFSSLMAGFDATVSQLRLLRQTVENIEVGDGVIGRAAQRYAEKMAVVRGGQF